VELRPYQQKAVEWLCEHERGLVVAAAGSGKTIVAAAALAKVVGNEPGHIPMIGWAANTSEQTAQALAAIEKFNLPGKARVIIHCAAAGKDWSGFDALVVDEAHHAPSPTWRKQIESCKGVRWGFTATPWGRDRERNEQLKALFGGNVYVIEREEVASNLCPARVVWLDACDDGLPGRIEAETEKVLSQRLRFRRYQRMPIQQARGEVAWGVCAELGIAGNAARNNLIIATALAHSEQTVVLCNTVAHVKDLAAKINGVPCYSGMPKRAETIQKFREGKIQRIVASTMLDEGADLPCIEVLILCGAGRAEGRVIQRAGRALRPHPGKLAATIYDFKDSTIPLMHRHAQCRAEIYEKLGYEGGFEL